MEQVKRIVFDARSIAGQRTGTWWLYRPFVHWDRYKVAKDGTDPETVDIAGDTELVIGGFQGSANSFASELFEAWQDEPVKVAHHIHVPVQVIRAIQRGLPTVVTVRDPRKAILSLTSRWPHVGVQQALKGYIRFYETLKPYNSDVIISGFDRTTGALSEVIGQVNRKFGTDFATSGQDGAADQLRVRHSVAGKERQKRMKEVKGAELDHPRLSSLCNRAEELHQEFLALEAISIQEYNGS